jgi:hypothetical protein
VIKNDYDARLAAVNMVKKPKNTMSGVSAFLGALNEANRKVEEGIFSYKHASEVPEEISK